MLIHNIGVNIEYNTEVLHLFHHYCHRIAQGTHGVSTGTSTDLSDEVKLKIRVRSVLPIL